MAGSFMRRSGSLSLMANPIISKACNLYSTAFRILDKEKEIESYSVADKLSNGRTSSTVTSSDRSTTMHLSPLLPSGSDQTKDFHIELVDPGPWQVSSILAHAWSRTDQTSVTSDSLNETVDGAANQFQTIEDDTHFDEIVDMRHRGKLFYKLDRDSREFEEYNINFRRKHSPKKNKEKQAKALRKESNIKEEAKKNKEKQAKATLGKESNRKGESRTTISASEDAELATHTKNSGLLQEIGNSVGSVSRTQLDGKKMRKPTYNQLTGPYHEPFCLDIYISKSSVRACIVHRVTSKVVAVAHSISKDLKYDLASTKDSAACTTVGGVLAQRAIADDIHNVVYTPRKGEKLEGKLQIVLQSVINNGIDVKVKIKQREPMKVPISFVKQSFGNAS
ncbi:uncharacterized protein LOC131233630 [Magnolia sinica]|uniref:uncharacterized protein LOC131233630 n=1 Tax=Magnolia sinica TaxID=86752 RepID=UPI00265AE680|nr:uncharacterized protein LOC131233630 [Magnolia sinica]